MGYQIEPVDLKERRGLAVTRKARWPDLASEIGAGLETVRNSLSQTSSEKAVPFVLYKSPSDDGVDLVVGFLDVSEPSLPEGIEDIALPEGSGIQAVHKGAYNELGRAHDALFEWARARGYDVHGGSWEVYVDDPNATAQNEVRTNVYLPLPIRAPV